MLSDDLVDAVSEVGDVVDLAGEGAVEDELIRPRSARHGDGAAAVMENVVATTADEDIVAAAGEYRTGQAAGAIEGVIAGAKEHRPGDDTGIDDRLGAGGAAKVYRPVDDAGIDDRLRSARG